MQAPAVAGRARVVGGAVLPGGLPARRRQVAGRRRDVQQPGDAGRDGSQTFVAGQKHRLRGEFGFGSVRAASPRRVERAERRETERFTESRPGVVLFRGPRGRIFAHAHAAHPKREVLPVQPDRL